MTNDVHVYAGERSRRENREVPYIVRDLSKDSGKRQIKLCYVAGQHCFYCRTQVKCGAAVLLKARMSHRKWILVVFIMLIKMFLEVEKLPETAKSRS